MLRDLIESFMGPGFTQVLNFYEANSLPINLAVLAYGTLMLLAYSNLSRMRKRLLASILVSLKAGGHRKIKLERALKEVDIPWQDAVSASRFPFVARQMALIPHRASVTAVQSLLPAEDLIREAMSLLDQASESMPAKQ